MTPPERPGLPYRPCVGVVLFNQTGGVFVGRRAGILSDDPYAWQMPQGGIDDGESPRDAAFRELAEETGVTSVSMIAESPDWYEYDLPPSMNKKWSDRFRGQTQKWFALNFEGGESEINLQAHGKPEFDDWRWVTLEDTPDLIVPFKRRVYEHVVRAFRHISRDRRLR